MKMLKIVIIFQAVILFIGLLIIPHQALALIACQANEQCLGMGRDPNEFCNPRTTKEACESNSCCRWLDLPADLITNPVEIVEQVEQEVGPKLIIPDIKINLPGLLFSDQNKIQTGSDGENTFFYIPWIGEYLAWLYKYSIGTIGLLAIIAVMIGGFYWLLAGGNTSRVSEAKNWINAAISGLGLALGSYLILVTINSNLVKLSSIKILGIKRADIQYEIRNNNISAMNMQLGPGDYCGCFPVENLTYAASGFNNQKVCDLLRRTNAESPYIQYCDLINDLCRNFNIDPAYVIAQWAAESSLGTNGAAKVHNNPGNYTCSRAVAGTMNNSSNGYTAHYTCIMGSNRMHIWRHYSNLREGLIGYFINKKTGGYFTGNIRPNIYKYAPPGDGNNNPDRYISMIVKFVNQNSNNKHLSDETRDSSCPCPTTR